MKFLKSMMVVLIVISLFGCGSDELTITYGEDAVSQENMVAFKAALTREELKKMNDTSTMIAMETLSSSTDMNVFNDRANKFKSDAEGMTYKEYMKYCDTVLAGF